MSEFDRAISTQISEWRSRFDSKFWREVPVFSRSEITALASARVFLDLQSGFNHLASVRILIGQPIEREIQANSLAKAIETLSARAQRLEKSKILEKAIGKLRSLGLSLDSLES